MTGSPGTGSLYLVPTPLGDVDPTGTLPPDTLRVIARLRHFVVENARTARRFLGRVSTAAPVAQLALTELNEHTGDSDIPALLDPLLQGDDLGLLSEAGCPAVADPGAKLVALAHLHRIRVVPLVGPSAILLALMASGLNGQHFTFLGYLPAERETRRRQILRIEQESARNGATYLWIETPYRADAMLEALLATCDGSTKIGIAVDLTLASETTTTLPVSAWRQLHRPSLAKRPTVFLLDAAGRVSERGRPPVRRV